jgi:hypothetical protein
LLLVGRFNDLRKQLAERAEIRGGDRQHQIRVSTPRTASKKRLIGRRKRADGITLRGQHAKRQGEDGPKQRA